MSVHRKKQLFDLGAEALADALLELAVIDEIVDDTIDRLIGSPIENLQHYKAKLAGLKNDDRFVSWQASAAFARELEMLLKDLESGVEDPRIGVELIADFYRADSDVFERCDDSDGNVGDVYLYDAKRLFVAYASKCPDKQWLSELVVSLCREDNYSVRDVLMDCAAEYLPETVIRDLIERCQTAAGEKKGHWGERTWLARVESLARQINDADLFEKTRIAGRDHLTARDNLDIARVYLESGDVQTALAWTDRVSPDDVLCNHERDRLLFEIHGTSGNREKHIEIACQLFRQHRSVESISQLLTVIGEDQRGAVIESEVSAILEAKRLSHSDARFLVEMEQIDAAESYLMDRADQFDGDYYTGLLPLAEAMETNDRLLCASLLYRALIDSILQRAQSKAYPHGVRYLEEIDSLAASISDWQSFDSHADYIEQLRQKHGRKYSFWRRYAR